MIPGCDIPKPSGKKGLSLVPHLAQATGALDMDNSPTFNMHKSLVWSRDVPCPAGLVKGHFTIQVGIPEAAQQLQGRGSWRDAAPQVGGVEEFQVSPWMWLMEGVVLLDVILELEISG